MRKNTNETILLEEIRKIISQEVRGLGQVVKENTHAIEAMDRRVSGVETRMGGMEARMGGIEDRMFSLEDKVDLLKERIDNGFADTNKTLYEYADIFTWMGNKVFGDHEDRLKAIELERV